MKFDGVRLRQPNPDGLDPVYEAYQLLRDLFELGKIEHDELKYEDGSYAGTHPFLVLPTGDAYPEDDTNPLDELGWWLVEQHAKRLEEEDDEEQGV